MNKTNMRPGVKPRDTTLDITKGIAILLVIIGHCRDIPYMPIGHFIFTFHMPLFFLVSGFFYKERSFKDSLSKDIVHLGVPYVITCLAILLFYLLYWGITGSSDPLSSYAIASFVGSGTRHSCKLLSDLPVIGAIWFLPALLVCKNTYNLLPKRNRILYSSVIFVVATIIGRYVIFIPFSVLSGLSAIIFYAIGDYLKGVKTITTPYWILGLICWVVSFKYSHIYIVQPQLDLYFVDVVGATTASILVFLLSKEISKIPIASQGLSWIGKSSLVVLCFHQIDYDCGIATLVNPVDSGIITTVLSVILPVLGALCFSYMKGIYYKIR